jgi:hypothetical protein
MKEPTVFKPHALSRAPVIRECRYAYVPTTTDRDWSGLDQPACERLPARSVCAREFRDERYERVA